MSFDLFELPKLMAVRANISTCTFEIFDLQLETNYSVSVHLNYSVTCNSNYSVVRPTK